MGQNIRKLTTSAICLALCIILPYFTGQIPQIGQALGPMHIPVLLCGFIAGPAYAAIVGFAAPLLRLMIAGMPMPFMAMSMCFELAVYGLVAGVAYRFLPKKPAYIYVSLIMAMLLGRIAWGMAAIQLWLSGFFPRLPNEWTQFGWEEFLSGAFLSSIPGIILHILLIPPVVIALKKAKLLAE